MFILHFTLIISSKIIYKGTSLSLCLQHVTTWRGNTAGFIIKNIIWHFKYYCAHYCQASKENILTKENKLLHCRQKPVVGFFFFSVRFTFFKIDLHIWIREFCKNVGTQGNFILNSKYLLIAVVSRKESSMKCVMSLWVWNKTVVL